MEKNYTEVLIDGTIYTLGGTEEETYLQRVAVYLNDKISRIRQQPGFSRQSAEYQALMTELNIADDYFKEQERADLLAEQKASLEKDAYSLKHELITLQMKKEHEEQELELLQRENRELKSGVNPEMERRLAEAKAEKDELRQQLAESEKAGRELEEVRQQLAETKTEADEARQQLAEAEKAGGKLEEMSQELVETKAEADELRNQLAEAKSEADSLRQQLAESEAAGAENEAVRQRLADTEAENTDLKNRLAEAQASEKASEEASAEAQELKAKYDAVKRELEQLKAIQAAAAALNRGTHR